VSSNPTPKNPVGLKLAIQDKGHFVVYLARPCQYLSTEELKNCNVKYWTSQRLAKETVNSLNEVIDQLLAERAPTEIGLIGYSGGGAMVALLAEKRTDIDWFITLAGNLDHQTWTQWHHITPLAGSLNAIDIVNKIASIPQQHWWGTKDRIIPRAVIQSYVNKAGHPEWLKQIKGYNHHCCWEENWPNMLCQQQTNRQNKPWLAYFCRSSALQK
jgi:pimeloyl-ACP methyl ester carboxylesterase